MANPLYQDMKFSAEATAGKALVADRVNSSLADQVRETTGLAVEDVRLGEGITYTAMLTTKGVAGIGKKKYEGTSTTSVDDAIANAAKGKDFDERTVTIRMERTGSVPYFVRELRARALSPDAALSDLEAQVVVLRDRYGGRVVEHPQEAGYSVTRTSADYRQAGGIPEQVSRHKVVGIGRSVKSFADAETSARSNKDVKSTVYEAMQKIVIYGLESQVIEQPRAQASVESAAAPMAAAGASQVHRPTPRHDSGRRYAGGSPAAAMPASGQPATPFL